MYRIRRVEKGRIAVFQQPATSGGPAYLLWFVSRHYAYVGKWCLWVAYLLTIGGLLMWAIVDLFRVPEIVREHNADLATETLRGMRSLSTW